MASEPTIKILTFDGGLTKGTNSINGDDEGVIKVESFTEADSVAKLSLSWMWVAEMMGFSFGI